MFMNRLGLSILLISGLLFTDSYADPDPPLIKAIVEITLTNGTLIQGVAVIAYPCDVTKDYLLQGIYVQKGDFTKIILFSFDLDEIAIDQKQSKIVVQYESRGLVYALNQASPLQLKYIQNHFHDLRRTEIEYAGDSLTWNKDLTYRTTDLIPIESLKSKEIDTFRIDEIQAFRLVKNPSYELLGQLREKTEREKKERPADKSGDGFNEPVWYHEIIKDPRQLQRIQVRLVD